ncbi:SMI1/KNR4 family protein [Kibdelosporangium persicum]|uniref:SMI1/KNR4 family protein n=1 Tax=Kibdelosporangium persicum TaxID=2698649 RepID=A0ABX2EZU8_9PSEU|nr:SMI1/KNR4 family protein [Kibdelosporangium persicum]NRN64185.1 hypothetical protein [Kibdelosporangium persicum]
MDLANLETRFRAIARAVVANAQWPPGTNEVVKSAGIGEVTARFGGRLPAEVAGFFSVIGEVSLPDLWNGYFIGPLGWSADLYRDSSPREVRGHGEVVVVASNGGGTLYAIPNTGEVLALPPGGIDDGVYTGPAREVAESFGEFLERLTLAATSGERDPFDPYKS